MKFGSEPLTRRSLFTIAGVTVTSGLAGCLGDDESADESDESDADEPSYDGEGVPTFPEVEDPPEAVYKPTHYEGMVMPEPVEVGDFAIGPMLTYPHTFWIVTEDIAEQTDPSPDDDVHLMVTVWDRETDTVLPVDSGISLDIYRDDSLVTTNNPWLMISQEMGFHFGDNVPLDGDGHYRVEGTIPGIAAERLGGFANRFDGSVDFSFEFHFDQEVRDRMIGDVDYLPEEEWGEPGALRPMHEHDSHDHADGYGDGDHHDDGHHGDGHDHGSHHEVPYSSVPPVEALPGLVQDTPESGDAVLATTVFEPGTRFADDSWYVAVSPRTPYNRSVLPMMQLDGVIITDAEETESPLRATLDDEIGFHFGASFDELDAATEFRLEIIAPPQVARHQGYERAFLEMPPVTIDLDL